MLIRRLLLVLAAAFLFIFSAVPAEAYVVYDSRVIFLRAVTKDMIKILPRAMGLYIFNNQYDFLRGMTFMLRDIHDSPHKNKDLEEIRREAYERLMRDIPYCVEAFKGGDIKLDTTNSNLAGRLGMIAYSILLVKMPAFPDLEYMDKFARTLDAAISENLIDFWLYYDGYGDFHSLGELMERLRQESVPEFRHVRRDKFPVEMREDAFATFRAPKRFEEKIVLTDVDINDVYSSAMNGILDAFVYIWKCSGMDLAHPSYAAPPGTIISRPSRRTTVHGGALGTTTKAAPSEPPPERGPSGEEGPGAPPSGPSERPPGAPGGTE